MGGFGFTEAQEMFRKEVRNFVHRDILPGAKERSRQGYISKEIIKKVADMGLMSINIPTQYGGQPADWVTVGIAVEELAKGELFTSTLVSLPILGYYLMEKNPDLLAEWLPAMMRGEKICGIALTEPDAGSDAAAIRTRATRDGDGYILNGEKISITWGMIAPAMAILAKTKPEAGAGGISNFLVPLDAPGVTRRPLNMMGWKPVGQTIITLDGVRVPRRYLLGEENKAFGLILKQFDFTRACLALQALALAQVSLEEAMVYAQQRQAFGKPIAKYEGISFKIAEDYTLVEACRLLAYRTLWLRDQGLPHAKEAAMVKWLGPRVAVRTIHDALLIHGHVGYSEESPFEQRLRDAIGFQIADGTPEVMKLIVVRELMGREFAF